MDAKKNDFGWLLSVIAILLTGLIGLEGILLHFISRWEQSDVRLASIIFLVILWVVPTMIASARFKGYEKKEARQKDIEFEMGDRMDLYSLPDGRFLVLFKDIVEWETFQQALAAFQSVADSSDDVIGYYRYPGSLPFKDAEPVLKQQAR